MSHVIGGSDEDRMVRAGDLVGMAELAAYFGLDPDDSKLRVWKHRGKLPDPVVVLAAGPVFDLSDFAHFDAGG